MIRRRLALEWGDPNDPLPGLKLDHESGTPEGPQQIRLAKVAARRRRDAAKKSGDFRALIFCYIRQDRWAILHRLAASDKAPSNLADLFRAVWIDSEDVWRQRRMVKSLVRQILARNERRFLFTDEDLSRFSELPRQFTVYRGSKVWNRCGMSWTLNPQRAAYFASHHSASGFPSALDPSEVGQVNEITVRKSDCLFFTNERQEEEIILRSFKSGRLSDEGQKTLARYHGPSTLPAISSLKPRHRMAYMSELLALGPQRALAQLYGPEALAAFRTLNPRHQKDYISELKGAFGSGELDKFLSCHHVPPAGITDVLKNL